MSDWPTLFIWQGDAMTPANKHWQAQCDKQFVIGERYILEQVHERSAKSHNHYFSALHQAWLNLGEEYAEEFPTAEVLRKKALIRTGYRDERTLVCASKAEAERVAAFVKPADPYAIVTFRDAVVRIWTAKSQSNKAMGKEEFQRSKEDVLNYIAALIKVTPAELAKASAA